MQIDTIVTDLDDTLLNEHTAISPFTLETVEEAKRRGIRFIPASGRTASSMRRFIDQLNTGQPYIACNGAELMNADHSEIASSMFTPEQTRTLIRYFLDKGFFAQIYRGNNFYYTEETEISRVYARSTGMDGVAVGDLVAFADFPTPKVLCINTPEAVDALYPHIQADFPDVSFAISKPHFLEAEPKGVSKGAAIRQLSELLGFSSEHTMVFGDSLNDISMFGFTRHSVAMANARYEVKRAAGSVTPLPNTQDGLAHYLKDHVLT